MQWVSTVMTLFQLTAARRRLRTGEQAQCVFACFNSQPPEGGCDALM